MKLEKGRPTLLKEGDIILLTRSTVANPDIIAYKYLPSPFPRVIKCNNYKPEESLTQDNVDMLHCEERNDRICEEMVQSVENKREEDIPTAEAMDSNKIDVCIDTRSATSTCTGLSNSLACIANSRVHDNTENKGKDGRDEIQKYNLEINDLEAVGNTSTRTKPSPSDPCVSSHLKTTNCTEKVNKKCSHMKRKYEADEQWVRPRKVRFKEQIEEDLEHLTSLTGILVKNDDSHMDTDTDYASSGVTGKKSSTMILKDNRDFENGPQRDCGKVEGVTHPTTSLAMEVPRGSNIPSATGNPSGLSTSAEKCNSSPIESKVNRENYEQTSGFDSSTDDSQCGRCVHCEKWIPRVTISLHEAICEGHSQEPKSQDHVSLSSLPHESGFPEIQSPEKLATSSDENDITIAYDQSEDEIGQQDTDNRDTEREHNETPCAKEHIETQVVQGKCTEPKVSSTSTFTSRESAKSEECTTAKTSSSTEQHKLSLKSIQDETESISAPQNPVSLISSSTEHHELVPGSVQDENEPISVPHNPDTVTLSSAEQHEQALGSIQDENESISAPQNPATLEKEESEERCTFCSALLPVPDLILHVAACSKASAVPCTVADDPESIHEGCPYCANVFNVLELVEHVELCKSLSMIRAEEVSLEDCHPSPAAERGSDCETRAEENSSMRDRELCPKCNREFSLLELLNHAAECGRKKRRLVPLSISLRSPQGDVNDHFAASDADDSSERSADSEVRVGTVGDDVVVNSDRSDPNDSKLNDPICSSDEASDDKSGRNSHRITRRDIEDDGDSDVDRGEDEDDKNDKDDDRCKEEDDRRKEEDDDMFHGDYDHGNSRSDSDNSISCRDDDESEDEEDVDHESDSGDVWHNSSDCDTRGEEDSTMRDRELCPKCNREFSLLELLNHAAECGRKKRRIVPLSIRLRSRQGAVNDHLDASDADDGSERNADSESKDETVGGDVGVKGDREESEENDHVCSSDEASDDKSGRDSHRITRRDIEDDGDSDFGRGEDKDDENDKDDDRCKEEDGRRKEEDDDIIHGDYDHGVSRSDFGNSISCRDDDERKDEENVDHESDSGDVLHNECDDDGNDIIPGGCDYSHSDDVSSMCHDDELSTREGHSSDGEHDDAMETSEGSTDGDEFEMCPNCRKLFHISRLIKHASNCSSVLSDVKTDETVADDVGADCDRSGPDDSKVNDQVCSSDEASDDKSGRNSHRISRRDIEDDGDSDVNRGEGEDDENEKDDDRRKEEDDGIIHGDHDYGNNHSDYGNGIPCRDNDESKDEESVDHENDSDVVSHNECDDDGGDITHGGYSHLSGDVSSMCHDDELSTREGHSSDDERNDAMETSEEGADGDELEICPNCRKLFHLSLLIEHASNCSSILSDVKTPLESCTGVSTLDSSATTPVVFSDCSYCGISLPVALMAVHYPKCKKLRAIKRNMKSSEGCSRPGGHIDPAGFPERFGRIDNLSNRVVVNEGNTGESLARASKTAYLGNSISSPETKVAGSTGDSREADEIKGSSLEKTASSLNRRKGFSRSEGPSDPARILELFDRIDNLSSRVTVNDEEKEECSARASKTAYLGDSSSSTETKVAGSTDDSGEADEVKEMSFKSTVFSLKSSKGCSRSQGPSDPAGVLELFDRIDNLSSRVSVSDEKKEGCLVSASKTACLGDSSSSRETEVAGSTDDSGEADDVKAISLKRTASSLDSYHDCEEQCMYCLKMFAISELVEHASTCATLNKVGKVKSAYEPGGPIRPALNPAFFSMKRLGILLLLPGWDGSPLQG